MADSREQPPAGPRVELLYHFCRLQLPAVPLARAACEKHLVRTYVLFRDKAATASNAAASNTAANAVPATWDSYLDNLYPLDWFLACACLDGVPRAWDILFASRAGRSDLLLVDALRSRAARLYPRDEEKQDSAVSEFWSNLVAPERPGSLPILARFDGERPLVPWLIRVFQNWHVSQLRRRQGVQALPEDDLALPMPEAADSRWRDVFAQATRDWLAGLKEDEILLLGLRLRHRLSQREVAQLLGVHEGTISRRTDALRDACLEQISRKLVEQGWTGEDVFAFVRSEMHGLLLDEPRLSVDFLAQILGRKGKKLAAGS